MKTFSKGFTLIEILLVIALIGAVAATIITLIDPVTQFKKARDTQRKSDLRQIQAALELYRADNGVYPVFGSGASCNTINGWDIVSKISCTLSTGSTVYMKIIPDDPTSGANCPGYLYRVDPTQYTIFTKLENVNDPVAVASKPAPYPGFGTCDNAQCSSFTITAGTCNGSSYNYWVTNP